ncbi:MAG: hypothetical protein K2K39_02415, partial [Clostridia bacterium]|nr:hypothetical protein [Clostridia bacterium]
MKRKLPTIITVVAAICAVALAAWGGYVFCTQVEIGGERPELYALIPIYIIILFIGAFLAELVHEGAHFLIGAICSMGVKVPKVRIFKSSSVDVFPRGAKALKLRFVLTAGAGLFFDLLLIALGVIAFAAPSVHPIFGVMAPYALYSFIVNVAPLEYRAGKTDGLVIVEALSKSPSSQVMFAILKVQGLVNGGVPLKEIDEGLILDVPQVQEDDINFIILTQLRYEYYLAKNDDSEAYKYFLRYKELIRYLPSEYTGGYNNPAMDGGTEAEDAEIKPDNAVEAQAANDDEKGEDAALLAAVSALQNPAAEIPKDEKPEEDLEDD